MSVTLFPIIQPQIEDIQTTNRLYKEVAWDYKDNKPIYKNGSPYFVTGKEAVTVWAWKALNTPRFRHEIYSWDYGNEADSLIGQYFSDELKRSEGARFVRECLLVNPYITDVSGIKVTFTADKLVIECKITTLYGEVELNV